MYYTCMYVLCTYSENSPLKIQFSTVINVVNVVGAIKVNNRSINEHLDMLIYIVKARPDKFIVVSATPSFPSFPSFSSYLVLTKLLTF